ncbi:ankyrin repeat-containing domain protein [Xylogone sp. PMI_703]|nr:ankyrin repeat-containing domain protein [Xylogone sp. PMI_703]
MSGFEVLGAVAAAGQFLEQGITLVKLVRALYDQVQNAPEELSQRCEELRDFNSIVADIKSKQRLQTTEIAAIICRATERGEQLTALLGSISFEPDANIGKKTWKALVGLNLEKDIFNLLADLEREKSSLQLRINLIQVDLGEATREGVYSINEKIERLPKVFDTSTDAEKCRRDLFITDPVTDREGLTTAKGEIVPGTCDWIESKPEYQSWLASQSGLLWISGGPGKGKTMLSIYLTQQLQRHVDHSADGTSLTYFFCDDKNNSRNNATAILRGLLHLLIEKIPDLVACLLDAYKIQQEKLFTANAFEALWRIFLDVVSSPLVPMVYAIIDGLDECESSSLEILLKKFRQIYNTPSPADKLKIIVVSREHPECLTRILQGFPRIRLDPNSTDEVHSGIELYISSKTRELAEQSHKSYPPELLQHVEKTLLERADGTYLWVSFVIQDLEIKEPSDVEQCLEDLPKGLDGIYERMLVQIPPDQRSICREILLWIVFAEEPLSIEELVEAVGVKGTDSLTASDVIEDKLKFCGHFTTVHEGVVTLVHQSAKDFLSRRKPSSSQSQYFSAISAEEAHTKLAITCLAYLQSGCLEDERTQQEIDDYSYSDWYRYGKPNRGWRVFEPFPLLVYAAVHWSRHAQKCGKGMGPILDKNPLFFSATSQPRNRLGKILNEPYYTSDIHIACKLGLLPWIERLLHQKRHRVPLFRLVNKRDISDGDTPAHAAVESGDPRVLELLLQHRANIDAPNSGLERPLTRTIWNNDRVLCELLLRHGANPNAHRVLHVAAWWRRADIVQLLLDYKAGPVARGVWGPTALDHAFITPNLDIIQVLLRSNPKLLDKRYRNGEPVIFRAMFSSSVAVIQLLLEYGVDPNEENDQGETALFQAVRWGDESLIRYLVDDLKLNLNHRNKYGETALHLAARGSSVEILRLLVDRYKLDPLARTGTGSTLLHLARSPKIIAFLCEEWHFDPNAHRQWGNTPLHAFLLHLFWYGDDDSREALRLLLKHGADPNLKDDKGLTPREKAVGFGCDQSLIRIFDEELAASECGGG